VCGLGPGDERYITAETLDAIGRERTRFVRTRRHPTAGLVQGDSFDYLYDRATTFAEVYTGIVDELLSAAKSDGDVLYAVPGSPLVLENSVKRLRQNTEVDIDLLPAMSFLDLAWNRLMVDPVDDGVRLVDGHRFEVEATGQRGPLLVAHVHDRWILSDIKLSLDDSPQVPVVVLQGLGTPDESIFEVAWSDLDREINPDHLTTIYIPELSAPVGSELMSTVQLMEQLRSQCPWDQAQDHATLRPYLLEECYEVLEALDSVVDAETDSDLDQAYVDLEEELGDLWFQILFHSRLAAEQGQFTISDVARTIHDKLVARHPHVFGGSADSEPVSRQQWEQAKLGEKGRQSILDGIPAALPALALAEKMLDRAAAGSVHVDLVEAVRRITPSAFEWDSNESVGQVLLAAVVLASDSGVNAESALRGAVAKATTRFKQAEAAGSDSHQRPDNWPFEYRTDIPD